MTVGADSYALTRRWQRAQRLFQETRAKRGWRAATILMARTLLLKAPLLLRHLWAVRRTAGMRAAIANGRSVTPDDIFLAVAISGGLGDMLVIARFMRDLKALVGNIQFDVFSPTPKNSAWAFQKVPGFRDAYHDVAFSYTITEYDLAIRANQSAVIYQEHIRWGAVRQNYRLMGVIDRLVRFRPKIEVFVDHHPWLDHFLARTAVFADATRRDFLHVMAGLKYSNDRLATPQDASAVARFNLRPYQYVTVHNGFDPGFVISARRATKCYAQFGTVVALLKDALPDIKFVQIGSTTSEPIAECDLNLLNQTSLDEVSGLLGQALLHLDNEGGLVHLAACLGTRSAVVFGPTPADYFGYPDNINIAPPVCGGCWYMTRTWMDTCARGYDSPLCLTEQKPATVAERVLTALTQKPAQHATLLPYVRDDVPSATAHADEAAAA